jgi:hypothetical protein
MNDYLQEPLPRQDHGAGGPSSKLTQGPQQALQTRSFGWLQHPIAIDCGGVNGGKLLAAGVAGLVSQRFQAQIGWHIFHPEAHFDQSQKILYQSFFHRHGQPTLQPDDDQQTGNHDQQRTGKPEHTADGGHAT